jgi:hypothetical protein
VRESVCTLSIAGGATVGEVGAVVVVVVLLGALFAGGAAVAGSARNLRSLT